jgi:hypothetical protein
LNVPLAQSIHKNLWKVVQMSVEQLYFESLFRYVDRNNTGSATGHEVARLFETSGIDNRVLAEIWKIATKGVRGPLPKERFFIACKLLGLAQSGAPYTMSALENSREVHLPKFAHVHASAMWEKAIQEVARESAVHFEVEAPSAVVLPVDFQGNELDMECPICMEQFTPERNIPKLLPCTHDVCDQCIASLLSKRCPVCRKSFNSDLGTDRTLLKAIKIVQSASLSRSPSPGAPPLEEEKERPAPAAEDMAQGLMRVISNKIEAFEDSISSESDQALKSMKVSVLKLKTYLEVVQNCISDAQDGSGAAIEMMKEIRRSLQLFKSEKNNSGMAMQTHLFEKLLQSIDTAFEVLKEARAEILLQLELKKDEPNDLWITDQAQLSRYSKLFLIADSDGDGEVKGKEARDFLSRSELPPSVLKQIWNLADVDKSGSLNQREFLVAMHLVMLANETPGIELPQNVPQGFIKKVDINLDSRFDF